MSIGDLVGVSDNDELRRRVLWALPTALGVMGSTDSERSAHLMNVSWITPVANEPTRLVASIESKSKTAANFTEVPRFSLSLVLVHERELGRLFVKPVLRQELSGDIETVQGRRILRDSLGVAYLFDAVAVMSGHVEKLRSFGEHDLWLLEVDHVAADPRLLQRPASEHALDVLGVHHTRMNYGS
jgi:flavin reductase (DIM6/NTAB) family NADH-FMN oxidoreductase RutF